MEHIPSRPGASTIRAQVLSEDVLRAAHAVESMILAEICLPAERTEALRMLYQQADATKKVSAGIERAMDQLQKFGL